VLTSLSNCGYYILFFFCKCHIYIYIYIYILDAICKDVIIAQYSNSSSIELTLKHIYFLFLVILKGKKSNDNFKSHINFKKTIKA
jgi:hypothetical protein